MYAAQVEEVIDAYNRAEKWVAGVVSEPIQAEGGDNHGSPEFFQGLQKIARKVGNTECAGWWAVRCWCLELYLGSNSIICQMFIQSDQPSVSNWLSVTEVIQ